MTLFVYFKDIKKHERRKKEWKQYSKQLVFHSFVPNRNYLEHYYNNMNNPNINTFLQNEQEGSTREQTESWIDRHQQDYTFSMLSRDTREFIGNCSIRDIENNSGEIGIFISPTFQNQGLGTEAIAELIRIGFNELNLEEIRLIVFSHNERAIHVYENLGFREYNRITAVTTRNNEPVDDIYMVLRRN